MTGSQLKMNSTHTVEDFDRQTMCSTFRLTDFGVTVDSNRAVTEIGDEQDVDPLNNPDEHTVIIDGNIYDPDWNGGRRPR